MTEVELIVQLRELESALKYATEFLRANASIPFLLDYTRASNRLNEIKAELDNRTNSACI